MSDPATYRPASGSIPEGPGVYRWRDEHGRVIYVGKAKSLRGRLNSYFADPAGLHPRTRQMVTTATSVDWVVVRTEVEALQLEYSWIKEYDPRFNVKYRDDKSYPWLAVTVSDPFPRLQVMRGAKKRGVRYFGPYAHAWAIRETLDLLLRVFPARTCSTGVFRRAGQIGRPCLLGYIDKCSAPCVGKVTEQQHRAIVEDFCDFMAGGTGRHVRRLEREMAAAAQEQEYERAARLRDDIAALNRALEKQAVVLPDGTDADVIGVAEDSLEAAVQVFHVRGGRVRGQRGYVVDKVEELSTGELVGQFLVQVYGDEPEPSWDEPTPVGGQPADPDRRNGSDRRSGTGGDADADSGEDADAGSGADNRRGAREDGDVPREVLVPDLPPDADALTDWLCRRRGANVSLRVPQRGDKKALLATVTRNALQAFALHKTRRASDLTARSTALRELQDALGLDQAPLRIECFDVSNLQGTSIVASMVVFEDGLARKSEYRRFAVRGTDGQDDTGAMHEVVRRRFSRYLQERSETGQLDEAETGRHAALDEQTGRPKRFAYPPQLVVVDGGAPQVAAARRALDELGIDDVALVGLAKRLEEVWLPGDDDPLVLPRTSEGLYLLQRVRDEAHRFAIAYHRSKRSKSMLESALDDVPGLGETRRKALLRHFGSLKRLRTASVDDVMAVPGIGRRTADAVLAAVAPEPAAAFDPATGEVVG